MSAETILQVTNAIKLRLDIALEEAAGAGNTPRTTYVGPLDDTDAENAGLILFLYRVLPNQNLRNVSHQVLIPSPASGEPIFQDNENALALDLHYILTVGPRKQAGEPESLRNLGFAMRALNDAPVLIGSVVGGEIVRISLDSATTEEMSRVWALFPTANYRTSILYLASPVWIDPASPPTQAPSVVDQGILAGQGEWL